MEDLKQQILKSALYHTDPLSYKGRKTIINSIINDDFAFNFLNVKISETELRNMIEEVLDESRFLDEVETSIRGKTLWFKKLQKDNSLNEAVEYYSYEMIVRNISTNVFQSIVYINIEWFKEQMNQVEKISTIMRNRADEIDIISRKGQKYFNYEKYRKIKGDSDFRKLHRQIRVNGTLEYEIHLNKQSFSIKNLKKNKHIDPHELYILECQGIYKIGIADNVNKRIKGMTTGNPFPINIITTYKLGDTISREKEKQLHARFKNKHHLNEWFNLDYNDLEEIENLLRLETIDVSLRTFEYIMHARAHTEETVKKLSKDDIFELKKQKMRIELVKRNDFLEYVGLEEYDYILHTRQGPKKIKMLPSRGKAKQYLKNSVSVCYMEDKKMKIRHE